MNTRPPPAHPVGQVHAALSCVPALITLLSYVANQYQDVPIVVGYLFWLSLAVSVIVSPYCFVIYHTRYTKHTRPWFVSASLTVHTILLLALLGVLILICTALIVRD